MSRSIIFIAIAVMFLWQGCASTVFRVLTCERTTVKGVVFSQEGTANGGATINPPKPLPEVWVSYLNVSQLPKTGVEFTNDSGEFINRFIPRREVWHTNERGEFMGSFCPARDGEPSGAMLGFEKKGYKAQLVPVLSEESHEEATAQSCAVRAPGDCWKYSVVMQRK